MKTIPCPHCGGPIEPARLLGQLARGSRKRYSQEELARRAARLPHPPKKCPECKGSGQVQMPPAYPRFHPAYKTCPGCGGTGKKAKTPENPPLSENLTR